MRIAILGADPGTARWQGGPVHQLQGRARAGAGYNSRMNNANNIRNIAIVGGTGALGSGLAARWARAGYCILIGSRAEERARATARTVAAAVPGATVTGHANREAAARSDIVVLTVPFSHHAPILADIRADVQGKIMIDTTVPLMPPKVMRVQLPPAGSAALATQQILGPGATVVSAFQNVAADLLASGVDPECDVLVSGDQAAARETVVTLAQQAGFRAWHAGPLANSAAMEALTSVLIFLNKHYGAEHAGIRITGMREQR
jgi:NADPH-dependent F420 reductase